MSAADAREALEYAIRQAQHQAAICANRGKCEDCEDYLQAALAEADAYAALTADDRTAGRERLEQATAERTGRQP